MTTELKREISSKEFFQILQINDYQYINLWARLVTDYQELILWFHEDEDDHCFVITVYGKYKEDWHALRDLSEEYTELLKPVFFNESQ